MGKFVEFYGPGVTQLSIADRATISNMCPEYGATVGFFPVDKMSLKYLRQTGKHILREDQCNMHQSCCFFSGRNPEHIAYVEAYLKAAGMFRDYSLSSQDPIFSENVELDLSTVVPSLSGPKRPHDRVAVSDMKPDFQMCLDNKVGCHVCYSCVLNRVL